MNQPSLNHLLIPFQTSAGTVGHLGSFQKRQETKLCLSLVWKKKGTNVTLLANKFLEGEALSACVLTLQIGRGIVRQAKRQEPQFVL